MDELQGWERARVIRKLFQRCNVKEIREFLHQHHIDVNELSLRQDDESQYRWSPMVYAIANFDRDVMEMLLNEFGADFNKPCVCVRDGAVPSADDYLILHNCIPGDFTLSVEFMLDNGASPFVFHDNNDRFITSPTHHVQMVLTAKERLRTAWAAAWSLSQRPVLRDMIQPVAQRIMATPVREFLTDEKDCKKHKK